MSRISKRRKFASAFLSTHPRFITILLVDDQEVERQITRLGLEVHRDLRVVGETEDGNQAVELVRRLHPDVVVVDVDMEALDGPTTVGALSSEFPDLLIVGFSIHNDNETQLEMVASGASYYLSKLEGVEKLADLIREVASGKGVAMIACRNTSPTSNLSSK